MKDFDTIVIGSGAGGMTAALACAQAGHKVLVLEQHDTPGGWCHSFTLGGYRFSPGVHYLGQVQPGGGLARIYEGLGVSNDLTFIELNPDGFDHAVVGQGKDQFRFDIPKGKEAFAARLAERFPRDAKAIRRHLDAVGRIGDQLESLMDLKGAGKLLLPWRARTVLSHLPISLTRMLDRSGVKDPLARAVLSIQAGDHAMTPSRAPAVLHATVQHHYFNGGYYPQGGGFAIPRAFLRALKKEGGELELKARVERILFEPGTRKVIGVRLADGREIRCKNIVSNADPAVTFGRLVDPALLPTRLAKKVAKTTWSTSALSLFMAVDMDARGAGLDSGNVWYSRTSDIERMYTPKTSPNIVDDIGGGFLTTTTLKDPTKANKRGHHTMESFVFVDYAAFSRWAGSTFGNRPADYAAMKDVLIKRMLSLVDEYVPGLSDKVVFADLGTPLTNQHYVEATAGSLYGTEKKLRQLGPFAFMPRSAFEGLYLAGASTMSGHGIMGATLSGLDAAKAILGVSNDEILVRAGKPMKIISAEDSRTWGDAKPLRVLEGPIGPSGPAAGDDKLAAAAADDAPFEAALAANG